MEKHQTEERRALSVKEAAQTLGLGVTVTYEAIRRGDIPALKIGGRWIIPIAGLQRKLEQEAG